MYLTSVTNLKLSKESFFIIDQMSYRAKALYNSSLYQINKEFKDAGTYLNYGLTDVLMKSLIDDKGNIVYASLPSALAQQTIKKLHKNFKSFFSLLKKKQDLSYDKDINTPRYLAPEDRKELIYTKSKTSQSFIFKNGFIWISVSEDLYIRNKRLKLCPIPKYLEGYAF